MLIKKPHIEYPEMCSIPIGFGKTKKGYWTVTEYYGDHGCLKFDYWKYDIETPGFATGKIHFSIPITWKAFYIQFIYKHTGSCHKDLRSKFYVGKARENK